MVWGNGDVLSVGRGLYYIGIRICQNLENEKKKKKNLREWCFSDFCISLYITFT